MRKTFTILTMIVVFLLLYFLQINFFNWFTIAGISPNLFVIYILFIGLFAGKRVGLSMGIGMGLALDFYISKKIGILGIMLGATGVLGGFLSKNFSKDSRLTIILMTAIVTLIYEIGLYLLSNLIVQSTIEILPFIKIAIIEMLYNVILIIILYPFIQKVGFYIEETFRQKQILTKYF